MPKNLHTYVYMYTKPSSNCSDLGGLNHAAPPGGRDSLKAQTAETRVSAGSSSRVKDSDWQWLKQDLNVSQSKWRLRRLCENGALQHHRLRRLNFYSSLGFQSLEENFACGASIFNFDKKESKKKKKKSEMLSLLSLLLQGCASLRHLWLKCWRRFSCNAEPWWESQKTM